MKPVSPMRLSGQVVLTDKDELTVRQVTQSLSSRVGNRLTFLGVLIPITSQGLTFNSPRFLDNKEVAYITLLNRDLYLHDE